MIVIDSITNIRGAIGTLTFTQRVSSSDAVLVIFVGCDPSTGTNISTVKVNGVNLPEYSHVSSSGPSVSESFLMFNPPVGVNTVTVAIAANSLNAVVCAITLLGVSKRTFNPVLATNSAATGSPSTVTIQAPSANSLILDHVYLHSVTSGTLVPDASQTQIQNEDDGNGNPVGVSFKYGGNSLITSTWTLGTGANWAATAIAFEPDQAPSLWFPNDAFRNRLDVVNRANLNTGTTPLTTVSVGYLPSNFFLNSFLHTIGRILSPPTTSQPTLVAETERPTAQIIIDKVFQGQIAAQALSTVNLNLQVDLPSPDAVLVVTGGSVITTGAAWASVYLDGQPLTNLAQAIVAGADAEIWWLPYPPVGSHTLQIASGTGGEIYANAMVLLGVDKRSTNIVAASVTDAASTSTITVPITPDAPNSLIIDTLSTINVLESVPDSSQNQVFNASALASNEEVLSSYKIGNVSGERMSWNLGVAVNASLVAVSFRPAQAASIWFPNVESRSLSDIVDASGLDAGVNPAFGNYGYIPTLFWHNSFLHTVGRVVSGTPLSTAGPLVSGLIAYWTFDETTGTDVREKVNQLNGIWQGQLLNQFSKGIINGGGNFDGTNYVLVKDNPLLDFVTTAMTISAWVYPTEASYASNTGGEIVKKNQQYILRFSNSQIQFIVFANAQGTLNAGALLQNVWNHIVVVYDGNGPTSLIAYLNGQQVGTSSPLGGQIAATTNDLAIGAQPGGGENFKGLIDEVGIWSRPLAAYEVQALYNNGQGLQYPFLQPPAAFGVYDYHPFTYWQNSFFNTIGRIRPSAQTTAFSSTLLLMNVG